MPQYEVNCTSIASERYVVEAEDPEAARRKVLDGGMTQAEMESFRDLGHDDLDVVSVREA